MAPFINTQLQLGGLKRGDSETVSTVSHLTAVLITPKRELMVGSDWCILTTGDHLLSINQQLSNFLPCLLIPESANTSSSASIAGCGGAAGHAAWPILIFAGSGWPTARLSKRCNCSFLLSCFR